MHERDRYLTELAERLPLPDDLRDEIIEEIAGHLEDAVDALTAAGVPRDEAERRAVAHLMPPAAMAERFRRTHQTTRRLFAAAGGGIWAGGKEGLRGLLGAYFIGLSVVVTLSAVLAIMRSVLAPDSALPVLPGPAFFTSYLGLALWPAAWMGAGGLVTTLAQRSSRRIDQVRRPVALLGVPVVALVVARWEQAYDWPSVIIVTLVPALFVVGAMRAGRTLFPTVLLTRVIRGSFVVTLAVMVGMLVATAVAPGAFTSVSVSTEESPQGAPLPADYWASTGYDVVAPSVIDPTEARVFDYGSADYSGEALVDIDVDWIGWSGLTDLRVEAWRALPGGERLDPRFDRPYSVVQVGPDSRYVPLPLSKAGVEHYRLFLTATDVSTGERVAIGASEGGDVVFVGSPFEWFTSL